jgi:hypothetical protein
VNDFETVRYWMHGWGLPGRDWSEGDAALDRIEAEVERLRGQRDVSIEQGQFWASEVERLRAVIEEGKQQRTGKMAVLAEVERLRLELTEALMAGAVFKHRLEEAAAEVEWLKTENAEQVAHGLRLAEENERLREGNEALIRELNAVRLERREIP